MKKIIFTLFSILILVGTSSFSASFAQDNMNPVETSYVSGDYSYVGTFTFHRLDGSPRKLDVYEASNACGMYYVKVPNRSNNYYKLFSCNESGYNYYFSDQGDKWYVRI